MHPHLLEHVLAAMRVMIEAELAIGSCYQACSEKMPAESVFWPQLAREEEQHSRFIHRMMEILLQRPEEFQPVQSFSADVARVFKEQAQEREREFREGTISYHTMVHHLFEMENSLLESKYFKIVSGTDEEFNHLLSLMIEQTRLHYEKLQRRILLMSTADEADR